MRYERIKVKRDTNTVYVREVPEWEVPVIEFIFEEGNIERTGTFVDVTSQYHGQTIRAGDETKTVRDEAGYPVDAAKEFQRLAAAYGADQKSGVPHVASVYGQASAGVRALARAIADAKAAEAEAKPKSAGRSRAPRRSTAEGEGLLA